MNEIMTRQNKHANLLFTAAYMFEKGGKNNIKRTTVTFNNLKFTVYILQFFGAE